ncbi:MAG: phosphoadenylyl-sulfate reductase [Alphaproteobacteria bacterium]|nr:phosphoadenylyl-sulfate reductase [Alphaproteobacteria bacterium]
MNVTPRAARHLARLVDPHDVLLSTWDLFGGHLVLVTSLGPQTLVVLDMLHRLALPVDTLMLDTGLLFPETLALRDRLQDRYGVAIRAVRPARSVDAQAREEGPALWVRDPDRCCALRKIDPLTRALAPYDAWITGLRRDQGPTRADVETVAWDPAQRRTKVCPLAHWTRADVWTYLVTHDVPYNPLLDDGYPSVGCWPCTRRVAPGVADERAGRWAGRSKTECGLHSAGDAVRTGPSPLSDPRDRE